MMGSYKNMVNAFREGIAAFVAMYETRQIAQQKCLTLQQKYFIQIPTGPHQVALINQNSNLLYLNK